jgi:hypothetical protein
MTCSAWPSTNSCNVFGEMLGVARFFDAEAQTDDDKKQDQAAEDDQLEGEGVVDGMGGVRRMNAELEEQGVKRGGEPVVQQVG